jgi:cysteine desulfurase
VRIYFDYNATSPIYPEAAEAMARLLREDYGNASSVHAFGQRAKRTIDDARIQVAALIEADPGDLVFTSGGTEADNFALVGAAEQAATAGRRHLVASAIEHEAILATLKSLERRGWTVDLLRVDSTGVVSPDELRRAIRPDTAVVSVMHANNEVGTIQPVAELAAIAHEHRALFHTDAVQTAGKIPVQVKTLGVDLLSISGHKFGGPKGIGALWIRRGVKLTPFMTGGRQERNRRAGTENVPAIGGLGVAAQIAREKLPTISRALAAMRDRLEQGVLARIPGTAVNGDRDRRVPNTTNISFDGIEAESLLIALDLDGIAVSTGSACSSGSLEPSHVLRAMGLADARTRNSLRFSLGFGTTDEEIDVVLDKLPGLVSKLRRLTPSPDLKVRGSGREHRGSGRVHRGPALHERRS